jgi:hypothetical protein
MITIIIRTPFEDPMAHDPNFPGALHHVDAHRPSQANAANHCSQDRHEQQKRGQYIESIRGSLAHGEPGFNLGDLDAALLKQALNLSTQCFLFSDG